MEKEYNNTNDIKENDVNETESVDIGEVTINEDNNDNLNTTEFESDDIANENIENPSFENKMEDDNLLSSDNNDSLNDEMSFDNEIKETIESDVPSLDETLEDEEKLSNDDKMLEEEFENMDVEIEKEAEEPVEKEVEEIQKEPESTAVIFCENCGSRLTGFSKYCGKCGVKVTMKLCKHCGKVISVSESVCPYCNKELDDATSIVPQKELEEEETKEEIKEKETIEETKEKIKKEKNAKEHKHIVNMLRKRIVLGVQLLLTAAVFVLMFFVPILTSKSLFSVLGSLQDEPLITLDKIITSLSDGALASKNMVCVNDQAIFFGLPFMQTILGWFAASDQAATISVFLMLFIYGFIGLSLVLNIFICGFGMLTHRPIRGKSAKFTIITLVISAIFIYTNLFSENYNGYDSWIAYAFGLFFVYWVVVKILFFKEVKEYEESKY